MVGSRLVHRHHLRRMAAVGDDDDGGGGAAGAAEEVDRSGCYCCHSYRHLGNVGEEACRAHHGEEAVLHHREAGGTAAAVDAVAAVVDGVGTVVGVVGDREDHSRCYETSEGIHHRHRRAAVVAADSVHHHPHRADLAEEAGRLLVVGSCDGGDDAACQGASEGSLAYLGEVVEGLHSYREVEGVGHQAYPEVGAVIQPCGYLNL